MRRARVELEGLRELLLGWREIVGLRGVQRRVDLREDRLGLEVLLRALVLHVEERSGRRADEEHRRDGEGDRTLPRGFFAAASHAMGPPTALGS